MRFSQRKGLTPLKNKIQKDSMDIDLRSGLWNAFHMCITEKNNHQSYNQNFTTSKLHLLYQLYWHNFFKTPLDTLPSDFYAALRHIRKYFFECEWYEVYDFIEFTAQYCPDELVKNYVNHCNINLEKEMSAYRFIGTNLTDLTSEEEIESIEEALNVPSKYLSVTEHIKVALKFLTDRKSPNYRNSVKEAISAVEALSKIISENSKATLGSALKVIEKNHELHPAFNKALSNLYGYTNDENGIRHALLAKDKVTYTDAKFMLVSCSAFINYILGKIAEEEQGK